MLQSLTRSMIAESIPHGQNSKDVAYLASFEVIGLYRDTQKRSANRSLLDAAGVLGATVRLGFFKVGGELRYMICTPIPDADGTCQYYTVQDLELSQAQSRKVYRRINLDTIAALRVDFKVA